jgi:hypothetical protein
MNGVPHSLVTSYLSKNIQSKLDVEIGKSLKDGWNVLEAQGFQVQVHRSYFKRP